MQTLQEKLTKKFPHAVINMGFVTTETQEFYYYLDAAGRMRLHSKRDLTRTEIIVKAQPIDHVIQLTGDGPYKNHYYVGGEYDGFMKTSPDISKAHKMREYVAQQETGYWAHHAQYCYGGKFLAVKVNIN